MVLESQDKTNNTSSNESTEKKSLSTSENIAEVSNSTLPAATLLSTPSELPSQASDNSEKPVKREPHPLEGKLISVPVTGLDLENKNVLVTFEGNNVNIPLSEFEGNPEVGKNIEIFVSFSPSEKSIKLSYTQAVAQRNWKKFFDSHQIHQMIESTYLHPIKGGYLVDIGVTAFLPSSFAHLTRKELESAKTETLKFQVEILEMTPEKNNVVVSRKSVLAQERKKNVEDFLKSLEVGQITEGVVQDITDFGAFIRLGVIDGLLHIKDMSWEHINHPKDLVTLHQLIKVKILKVDLKNEKVSLGLKQITESLWITAEKDFPINSMVTGKVVSLKPFGAFVRLKEGIEGLLHISQISRKKLEHPSEILSIGQEVKATVLSVNPAQKRIALGMKQLEPDPWSDLMQKY
ncbi:MAG: S1 RNA-binding domain-containing protein, partial [Planctomycetota bacterium]